VLIGRLEAEDCANATTLGELAAFARAHPQLDVDARIAVSEPGRRRVVALRVCLVWLACAAALTRCARARPARPHAVTRARVCLRAD
jgi:hypothetical protein